MLTVAEKSIMARKGYRYARPRMPLGGIIVTLAGALFVLLSLVPAETCSEVATSSSSNYGWSSTLATSISSAVAAAPDLSITSSDIYITHGLTNISNDEFGKVDTIHAIVRNLGDSNANEFGANVGIRNAIGFYNHTLFEGTRYNLSTDQPENAIEVSYNWTIDITSPGAYEIWILLDPMNVVDENNESNNWAVRGFTLDPLQVDVAIATDKVEYEAGEMIVISATVTYRGTLEPVKHLPDVQFVLIHAATRTVVPDSLTPYGTTDADGTIVTLMRIPTTAATDVYSILALVLDEPHDTQQMINVNLNHPNALPAMLDVALVATVAAIAVIVALLLWKKQ